MIRTMHFLWRPVRTMLCPRKLGTVFRKRAMSPRISGTLCSAKGYVPDFPGRFFGKKLCPRKSGTVFRKKAMSPIFGDGFFGKALSPQILLTDSTDGAILLSKALQQTNYTKLTLILTLTLLNPTKA